jgi:hypothetical protein
MNTHGTWYGRQPGFSLGAALALCLSATACQPEVSGVIETADDPALGPALVGGEQIDLSIGANGLSKNGLNKNGLNKNGLNKNGLAAAALTQAGLANPSFAPWFNTDPALSDMVMRYLYQCAAPLGQTITWRNPATGVRYFWVGLLGLAPGWTSGTVATAAEQQVVSACLASLVNKYGVSMLIAVEGRTATGVQIPILPGELTTFSVREACFFGNLFTGQGVFVASDYPSTLSGKTSSARACAFQTASSSSFSTDCEPLVATGTDCRRICTHSVSGTFYESCSWGGVAYQPLTTRLRPADVYTCGDGVCQITEGCGTGKTVESCLADCGLCP